MISFSMNHSDYYLIKQVIENVSQDLKLQPNLEEIAKKVHVSPFHLQKVFSKWVGISPKKFLQFLTLEHTKKILQNSKNILDASLDAGLSSTSRLHDLFITIESITPGEYKSFGKNLIIYYDFFESPFGTCIIAVTSRGLCGLHFVDSKDKNQANLLLQKDWPLASFVQNKKNTESYFHQIFSNKLKKNLKLLLKGSEFQIQIWKALLEIPEGSLVSYESIAQKINRPKALRAVGTAIGKNPISFLIPCHRVINKLGVIGNYRWGRERKKMMIGWEEAKYKNSKL